MRKWVEASEVNFSDYQTFTGLLKVLRLSTWSACALKCGWVLSIFLKASGDVSEGGLGQECKVLVEKGFVGTLSKSLFSISDWLSSWAFAVGSAACFEAMHKIIYKKTIRNEPVIIAVLFSQKSRLEVLWCRFVCTEAAQSSRGKASTKTPEGTDSLLCFNSLPGFSYAFSDPGPYSKATDRQNDF